MKTAGWKKMTAVLLAGVLLTLGGCAGQSGGGKETGREDREKAMGRYVEKEITLPQEITEENYPKAVLQTMEDGTLAILVQNAGLYLSQDQGETWERRETPWMEELRQTYISHMALSPDGSAAVIYSELAGEAEDSESAYEPKYLYVDAKGEARELSYADGDARLYQFRFGRDGRLFAYSLCGKVYEVNIAQGTFERILETTTPANYVCFTEKYMVILASAPVVYNLQENTVEEDEVLQSFITEKVGMEIGSSAESYEVVAAGGESGEIIYLALEDGIYRHVIGGTAMEQVADGRINSLGDPQMLLQDFAVLPGNEFAVLYDRARLYRYAYDGSVPAEPEEQLSVYSLKEDAAIRQAISLFQRKNPDVYVRYEVGMTGNDGMTAEDAIKNLNTKMMSGNGPDLLVTDGLPEESYVQKGILTDLTEVWKAMNEKEPLLQNLTDALGKDGRLSSLPMLFQIPMIIGEKTAIEGIEDLSRLADEVERLRQENPQGEITGLFMEEQLLDALAYASSDAWVNENGEIDKEALTQFLTQAKRIYQAEIAGYETAELREKKETLAKAEVQNPEILQSQTSMFSIGLDIATGRRKLGIGIAKGMESDFNMAATLENQNDGIAYAPWQGQSPKSFVPVTRLAITETGAKKELAVRFFEFCFSQELQDTALAAGFPVNRASFEKLKEDPRGGEDVFGISLGDSAGKMFSMDIRWASEEQFGRLEEIVQSLEHACIGDAALERTVREIGTKALDGSVGVEEAVEEIIKKAAIYLAE